MTEPNFFHPETWKLAAEAWRDFGFALVNKDSIAGDAAIRKAWPSMKGHPDGEKWRDAIREVLRKAVER